MWWNSLRRQTSLSISIDRIAEFVQNRPKEIDKVYALSLHIILCQTGLEGNGLLGNQLVSILVQAGSLGHAQRVFDKLPHKDACSWNSLILRYVKHGHSEFALTIYTEVGKRYPVYLYRKIAVALLKACTKLDDIGRGIQIHSDIVRAGILERDPVVCSALVGMYGKYGYIAKSEQVFEEVHSQNVVLWTALITEYVAHGQIDKAVTCFEQMMQKDIIPDCMSLTCILNACNPSGSAHKGKRIHAQMETQGWLEKDVVIANALVSMYIRNDLIHEARKLLDSLHLRDVVTWTLLIDGYVKRGYKEEAFKCFKEMQVDGISPDAGAFICILKACESIGDLKTGCEMHCVIEQQGLLPYDLVLGNSLVEMYSTCGAFSRAQEVFDRLQIQDTVSWNALILGYTEHGYGEKVLQIFKSMESTNVPSNESTFVCILKACCLTKAKERGQAIHIEIEKKGVHDTQLIIDNALVDMYANCGSISTAEYLFNRLEDPNIISWTTIISAHAEYGHALKAIEHFELMQRKGYSANSVTFVSTLKACGRIGAIDTGQYIHAEIEKQGIFEGDLLGISIVDMYAKCGLIAVAQNVFDRLPVQHVVMWNVLLGAHADQEDVEGVFLYFKQMQFEGVVPDAVTYICLLNVCHRPHDIQLGRKVHDMIEKLGLSERAAIVNSLLHMYVKCGSLSEAKNAFNKLQVQDVITWTTMLTGYFEHGHNKEALECFSQMQLRGVLPTVATFVCILKICCSIGASEKGQEIHAEIERKGLLERDDIVANTLLGMYSKCGLLRKAKEVFGKLPTRHVVSWTILISGYAHLGECENAICMFDQMLGEGSKPDFIMYIVVLNACSRKGFFNRGKMYFESMSKEYGVSPVQEHYVCLVDLLGRDGKLNLALAMVTKMPFLSNLIVWKAILSHCRKWGNEELAKQAFKHAVHLNTEVL